jgi:hypothetical protein
MSKDVQRQRKDSPLATFSKREPARHRQKPEAVKLYEEAYKRDKSASFRLHNAHLAANQAQEAAKLAADWVKANPKDLTVAPISPSAALPNRSTIRPFSSIARCLRSRPRTRCC